MQTIHVPSREKFDHVVIVDHDMIKDDSDLHFIVGHDAVLNLTYLHAAQGSTETKIGVDLVGAGASVTFSGVQILTSAQRGAMTMTVRHVGEKTASSQNMRMIAGGESVGKFHGKVIVEPSGKESQAHQTTRGMLLSSRADLVAQPELEINNDDVVCTHGASIGQMDDDQIFYLTSRGVPMIEARHMLLRAFVMSVFDDLPDTQRQDMTARIDHVLAEMAL